LRDALLGRPIHDIDIAVETSTRQFGQLLSRALNGEFKPYPEFGTGTIRFRLPVGDTMPNRVPVPLRIDIARARTERYSTPAKLPKVKHADIEADLMRRDFTINAMAWNLTRGTRVGSPSGASGMGRGMKEALIDPFNGRRDLRHGIIRVLHDQSFRDDPTRIFRAERFAQRFDFSIEPKTAHLLRQAVKQDLLRLLSGKRVMTELQLIMNEENPIPVLQALNRHGVFAALFGEPLSRQCLAGLRKLRPNSHHQDTKTRRTKNEEPRTREGLTYLLSRLPEQHNLPLTREQKNDIASLKSFPQIRAQLARASRPSAVYALLKRYTRTALLIQSRLESKTSAGRIERYLKTYSAIAPMLKGKDLQALGIEPGPVYTRILEELRAARLDGKVWSRSDELAQARRLAGEDL
jgi:tRNA nucleotidyltransferase (CCA-adding enzyme)